MDVTGVSKFVKHENALEEKYNFLLANKIYKTKLFIIQKSLKSKLYYNSIFKIYFNLPFLKHKHIVLVKHTIKMK